jgi:class 3 adenylate cyclase
MEAPTLDRRLVAILAADVEGYSRLMALDEEAALATLSAHRAIADDLIVGFHGRIANTAGDSVLAEFASIVDAVRSAIEIQRKIAAANDELPEARRMLFRIGINVGDVMVKNGDIFGDGVNVAARLQTLADAGGICVSRGVRDSIHPVDVVRGDLHSFGGDAGVSPITPRRRRAVGSGRLPLQVLGKEDTLGGVRHPARASRGLLA